MSQSTLDGDLSEQPAPPPRRYLSFYIVLIFAVIPLWSIVPLSWAFLVYVIWSGAVGSLSWRARGLFVLSLCEALFSIYHFHLTEQIAASVPPASTDIAELQAAYHRVLQAGLTFPLEDGHEQAALLELEKPCLDRLDYHDPRAVAFRNRMRSWFRKAPWSQIRRREFYAWLHWTIFNALLPPAHLLSEAHKAILDEFVEKIEKRSGSTIPNGSNPAVQPVLVTLDPVNVYLRPFVWYVAVWVFNRVVKAWFVYRWGAVHGSYKGLEYLLHIPRNWSPTCDPLPVVFIHGLGVGLAQYKIFISGLLRSLRDRPLLIVLQPHISQDIFHERFLRPMGRHEMADCLAGLVRELGWVEQEGNGEEGDLSGEESGRWREGRRGVTLLSHSNGSYVHSWMVKAYPRMVARSCFADPITFCSWENEACYNFLYRPCSTGIELFMRYFTGTEVGVANLLQRHFDWNSNLLWFEEIPNARDPTKTMFLLGGKDVIVDSEVRFFSYSLFCSTQSDIFMLNVLKDGEEIPFVSWG
ncbi:hypothetical protein JAAARDRAFT_31292 [Jaapia argillacea MUCL 33604]|uniref:AB hydrolase-1 domain-containing protein n=1 Tax=Jaapia argillacea MUCL 33604 TaxID=933084 RepID=A0A067Q493_9AGAM|nr:hypothetical protein JAAARDRAFT_31292 [Jaapia argillacea MUCL 33604]